MEEGYFLIMRAVAVFGARWPQTFEVSLDGKGHALWSKHVRFAFASHYGAFHFCTLSLFCVQGQHATQTLKEEMEAIDAEAREVEEILRENDEANEILREKERADGEERRRRGGRGRGERTSRRRARARDGSRRRRRRRRGGWDRDPGIPGIGTAPVTTTRVTATRATAFLNMRTRRSSGDVRPGEIKKGGSSVGEVGARESSEPAEARSPSGMERRWVPHPRDPRATRACRLTASAAKANDERTKADDERTNGGRTTEGGCSFFGLGQRLKRLGRADDDAGRTRG